MTIQFDNYAEQVPRKGVSRPWFRWKVFVDEHDEVLDRIQSIEYRLHETFPDPIKTVKDRRSRFALVGEGWGEFTIYTTVTFVDGEEVNTEHYLDLSKPWPVDERG